jgi:hypothetical protein
VNAALVGLRPWLPWPLSRWRWWTEPVRAERLAVLRICLGLVLLFDVLTTYVPHVADYFGPDSLANPELLRSTFGPDHWSWSLLYHVEDARILRVAVVLWAAATACLTLGLATRLSAIVVWLLSTSFAALNPSIDNAGDLVRGIILLYLMLCPCGAVWSVDAWWWRGWVACFRGSGQTSDAPPRQDGAAKAWHTRQNGPVYVHPWPLRLLFVQMVLIYFCNGAHKFLGHDWREGTSLYYVLGDLTLARWSYAAVPIPYGLTRLLTWTVLLWELSFPLLMWWRPSRIAALAFGAVLHVGIWASLEIGSFAPCMLCLYLPLLPWERWIGKGGGAPG